MHKTNDPRTLVRAAGCGLALLALASIPGRLSAQEVSVLNVTTLAGAAGQNGTLDGAGNSARFDSPEGLAVDSSGTIYVADTANFTIRKITPDGLVTTLAGSPGNPGRVDGTESSARFEAPLSIVVDSTGNLFVGDGFGAGIRKVTPAGTVTTVAPGDTFTNPEGLALDGAGNLYVSDDNTNTISKIDRAGTITTVVSGNTLLGPWGVAADANGNLYVADTGHNSIKKITPGGSVTTVAGGAASTQDVDGASAIARFTGPMGLVLDGANNLLVVESSGAVRKISPDGNVTTIAGAAGTAGSADGTGSLARFNGPQAIAINTAGTLYLADTGNHAIRQGTVVSAPLISSQTGNQAVTVGSFAGFSVTTIAPASYQWFRNGTAIGGATADTYAILRASTADAGTYTCTATYVGSTATSAPASLTVSAVAPSILLQPDDQTVPLGQNVTMSVTATGTAPLSYQWFFNGNPITGATASDYYLSAVGLNASGAYSATVANQAGTVISRAATLTVLPTPVVTSPPTATATSGALFQYQVTASNAPTSFAATGLPTGLTIDATSGLISGEIGVTGDFTALVRATNSSGVGVDYALTIHTTAPPAYRFVGLAAVPSGTGVAIDSSGNLFVTEKDLSLICKVTADGTVTAFAGAAGHAGSVDGIGSAARFSAPTGIAVDASGNLYVADTGNHVIRKITPAGVTSTIAGVTGQSGSTDGSAATALFSGPTGIAVDAGGNIFVADTGNHTVRRITPAGNVTTLAGLAGQSGLIDAPGIGARFLRPTGLAVDTAGNLYVQDTGNAALRKITPAGSVSTLVQYMVDPNLAPLYGAFSNLDGCAVDGSGNVYNIASVSESAPLGRNNVASLRVLKPAGTLSLLDQWTSAAQNNTPSPLPPLIVASGVAVDAGGNLYFVVGAALIKAIPFHQTAATPPQIIKQPESTAVSNGPFSFSVTATGAGPLSYQWFLNGVAIPGANGATCSTIGGVADFAGGKSPAIGTYTVVVSNAAGIVTSAPATLTVYSDIQIFAQPQSVAVAAGNTISLSVGANATTNSAMLYLTYQWYFNGTAIPGANTSTYRKATAQFADSGSYKVVVGSAVLPLAAAVTSEPATVTVTNAPLQITSQPLPGSATLGGSFSLSVTATGSGTLTYQWYRNGVAITGATAATYTNTAAVAADSGSYKVVVSSGATSVTSTSATVVVAVGSPPTITTQPQASTTTVGGTFSLNVVASGTGNLTYQWYDNQVAIPGATSASFSKSSATASDAGSYTVIVSNASGNATSAAATVTVNQPASGGNGSGSGGGGGGGAPSYWFLFGLGLAGAARCARLRAGRHCLPNR